MLLAESGRFVIRKTIVLLYDPALCDNPLHAQRSAEVVLLIGLQLRFNRIKIGDILDPEPSQHVERLSAMMNTVRVDMDNRGTPGEHERLGIPLRVHAHGLVDTLLRAYCPDDFVQVP